MVQRALKSPFPSKAVLGYASSYQKHHFWLTGTTMEEAIHAQKCAKKALVANKTGVSWYMPTALDFLYGLNLAEDPSWRAKYLTFERLVEDHVHSSLSSTFKGCP